MKKIIPFLLAILACGSVLWSQVPVQPFILNNHIVVPDVMNNVNVLVSDNNGGFHNVTLNIDTFPTFANWPKNFTGTSFEGGIFCNMDSDPDLELVYCMSYISTGWVYALKKDGSNVPGWPKTLSYPAQGAPAFGDIDGDGQGEIVVGTASGSSNGLIYAFKKDGTPCTGFPINNGYTTRTIVLADLDGDGAMEIITNKRLSSAGQVWVYKGNGTVMTGWPKPLDHVPASSCAVGDINGDGFPEVIAESYNSLYAFDRNGNILAGFPFTMPNSDNNSYSSPVLADLNGDGKLDIIFGTHRLTGGGYVYAIKFDGTIIPNWPKFASQWIYGPPSVGPINGGNTLCVAIGDQVLSGVPSDFLYAWDNTGATLTGFPVGPVNAINDQVTIADVNNDNNVDLVFDDNSTDGSGNGKYLGYNHDGTPLSGWPIRTTGTTFFYTPCLFDIDHNNILDISGGANVGTSACNIYLWNTGVPYNPSKIYTPMWQYNTRHSGVYGDVDNPVGIIVDPSFPYQFMLSQNYPNPFNPSTEITYDISGNMGYSYPNVKLAVFDVLGKEVAVLVNSRMSSGRYHVTWNAFNMPSGVYFYKLTAGDLVAVKKMMLIK